MPESAFNKRGIVLFIVLGMLMVVLALTVIILNIINNQFRLTHHQTSRIQAHYAAQAGVNYALDRIRVATWTIGQNCWTTACSLLSDDADFPPNITAVNIIIRPANTSQCPNPPVSNGGACISATATYTWTVPS